MNQSMKVRCGCYLTVINSVLELEMLMPTRYDSPHIFIMYTYPHTHSIKYTSQFFLLHQPSIVVLLTSFKIKFCFRQRTQIVHNNNIYYIDIDEIP